MLVIGNFCYIFCITHKIIFFNIYYQRFLINFKNINRIIVYFESSNAVTNFIKAFKVNVKILNQIIFSK